MNDTWTADMVRLFDQARSDAGLSYGCWLVRPHSKAGFDVVDVNKKVIIAGLTSKPMAELIASIPDLCDPCLRPRDAPGLIVDFHGRDAVKPLVGVNTASDLYNSAYSKGFNKGHEAGWEDGFEAGGKGDPSGDGG